MTHFINIRQTEFEARQPYFICDPNHPLHFTDSSNNHWVKANLTAIAQMLVDDRYSAPAIHDLLGNSALSAELTEIHEDYTLGHTPPQAILATSNDGIEVRRHFTAHLSDKPDARYKQCLITGSDGQEHYTFAWEHIAYLLGLHMEKETSLPFHKTWAHVFECHGLTVNISRIRADLCVACRKGNIDPALFRQIAVLYSVK